MGQSAEELRGDIARTRDDLGDTLDAIGDRLSPGRMVERRRNRMSDRWRSMRERVMGSNGSSHQRMHDAGERVEHVASDAADRVRDAPSMARQQTRGNPLMAGGIAFGVGFLVAAAIPPSRAEREGAQRLHDETGESLTDRAKEAARETADHLKEPARDAAQEVKGAVTESAKELSGHAKDTAHATAQDARRSG